VTASGRARLVRIAAPALVAALAAALAAVPSPPSAPRKDAALRLEVQPVPLDPSDPARTTVGLLRFRGGLWLRSGDARFGGLSDLRVSPDGSRLLAVSDCGYGFVASPAYDARGDLAGLGDAQLVDLVGPGGAPLGQDERDAESLAWEGTEGLLVGFEGRPRILRYRAFPPFAGPAEPRPVPPGTSACGRNRGLETMAALGDGRLLLVCEGERGFSASTPAWVGSGQTWTDRRYPLLFEGGLAGEPFRPTAAAALAEGGAIVLERRFPPVGARLVRLSPAEVGGTGAFETHEIARLEAPLTLDNFEGVDVRRGAAGETLVYLISDDNNCAKRPGQPRPGLQRTLLLLFALDG